MVNEAKKPCALSCDVATLWESLSTPTTGSWQGPEDVTSTTALPGDTGVPTPGTVPTTRPVAYVLEHARRCVELTVSPAVPRSVPASCVVSPTTAGMSNFAV